MTTYLNLRSGNSGTPFLGENENDTLLWSVAQGAWYVGPGGGGGGAVASVFGRTGVVVAATGDYDSDQVDNVSSVAGATVSDALENLISAPAGQIGGTSSAPTITGVTDENGDQLHVQIIPEGTYLRRVGDEIVGATPAGGVSSVFGRTGDIVAEEGDYVATEVGNDSTYVGGSTVGDALDNVADVQNVNVATTGNVALTGTPANIDAGYTLVDDVSLILVWKNTDADENGVYIYNSGGAWTRAPRWSTAASFRTAQPFEILSGNTLGGRTAWVKLAPNVLDTDDVIFNVALVISEPTADNQTLQYAASTNDMRPAGVKTYQLGDADETVDLTDGSCMQLKVQLTQARTITIGNTGAAQDRAMTFDLRVVLAFPLTINNALNQQIRQFPAGARWFGGAVFSGQWLGLPYQEAT